MSEMICASCGCFVTTDAYLCSACEAELLPADDVRFGIFGITKAGTGELIEEFATEAEAFLGLVSIERDCCKNPLHRLYSEFTHYEIGEAHSAQPMLGMPAVNSAIGDLADLFTPEDMEWAGQGNTDEGDDINSCPFCHRQDCVYVMAGADCPECQ